MVVWRAGQATPSTLGASSRKPASLGPGRRPQNGGLRAGPGWPAGAALRDALAGPGVFKEPLTEYTDCFFSEILPVAPRIGAALFCRAIRSASAQRGLLVGGEAMACHSAVEEA
jgi:hypothetical protein